jgi:hypothetical protein
MDLSHQENAAGQPHRHPNSSSITVITHSNAQVTTAKKQLQEVVEKSKLREKDANKLLRAIKQREEEAHDRATKMVELARIHEVSVFIDIDDT